LRITNNLKKVGGRVWFTSRR